MRNGCLMWSLTQLYIIIGLAQTKTKKGEKILHTDEIGIT